MQIITVEDQDFPSIKELLTQSPEVGKYWKNGKVQIIRAANQFMLISPQNDPQKIAIKPARNQKEAIRLGLQFLKREQDRGNQVQVNEVET